MIKRRTAWIVWISLAALIKVFSLFPQAVEQYYAQGLYPYIASLQRFILGWLPFSAGDLLYILLILFLLRWLFLFLRTLLRRPGDRAFWLDQLKQVGSVLLVVYVVFNLLWGLNYNRKGIAWQLGIEKQQAGKGDLKKVMQLLALKVNELDSSAYASRRSLSQTAYLFDGAKKAYGQLAATDPRFTYAPHSMKSSLFGILGNYFGYTGYYNPFTGEAQVNTAVPLFVQPFTSCHEIGHQLGYARENEANFAGYLAARQSDDPAFRYSVYFDLYSYGRPYLYYSDSMALKQLDSTLHPRVKADFRELKQYYERYENPLEKVIDRMYGQYLKANEQPDGKVTYSKVVLWLVAYYKKTGTI